MAHVYRVGSMYGTEYFNTRKEADRCKPGEEEPEEFVRLDAATECNRLAKAEEETDSKLNHVRNLLQELLDHCDSEIANDTDIGRKVQKYIVDNPFSPATSSERDGQRSYGL